MRSLSSCAFLARRRRDCQECLFEQPLCFWDFLAYLFQYHLQAFKCGTFDRGLEFFGSHFGLDELTRIASRVVDVVLVCLYLHWLRVSRSFVRTVYRPTRLARCGICRGFLICIVATGRTTDTTMRLSQTIIARPLASLILA